MADTLPTAQGDCCIDCAEPIVTAIPGPKGDPCDPCSDGANGDNAWSLIDATVPVNVPACSGSAIIALQVPPGNAWMAVGQAVYISPYGYYEVTAVNVDGIHATVQNLCDGAGSYPDNIDDGVGITFANGSKVSPAGIQGLTGATPANVMLKTDNLSGLANLATSRTNLGLGTMAVQNANAVAITGGTITGITDLAVADGGTGASAAAGARTNLGAAAIGLATASGLTTSATDKVIGRSSAGAGAVEEIACTATGRTVISQASISALLIALGVAPDNVIHKIASYSATVSDNIILCDATAGAITIGLPSAASSTNASITVKKIDASANTVTVDGNLGETIDGALTQVISAQWTALEMHCDGSNWFIT